MNLDKTISVRKNKTVYRDGDRAIKLFSSDYSKADVLNEALNQACVEDTGIRIPKLLEVTTVNGQWALVMELIEGQTMAQLMKNEPDKVDDYLASFVDLQLGVHSAKAPMLNKLHDKMKRKIDQTDLDATTRYELHTRLAGMPKHDKVCHGDFNPSNIIISAADGLPYLLDWSHATQGNASADVARTYLLFYLDGQADLGEKYLQLFCKKSDTAKQYVQKWIPIVAASQSVKGNPEEREFLLGWVDVVEYE
jgi:tRNA A-37 threonylcarbamoyl transferase component Bud32